jgi:molybdate transport system substrate-binding protein
MKPHLSLIVLSCIFSVSTAQDRILIAAASDLKFAMDSVISVFNLKGAGTAEVTYGSSGKLCEQIINGAPFDLFFSADAAYAERLHENNKTASPVYQYAKGRIVIWSQTINARSMEMKSLLDPTVEKIAIANPAHAPYGKRAIETLEYFGLLVALKPKLVYGENISQAAQFISSGAADIGIIALSLALSPNMKKQEATYYLIPESSHQPLIQAAAITSHGRSSSLAKSFFNFIQSDQAVSILRHYGFTKP